MNTFSNHRIDKLIGSDIFQIFDLTQLRTSDGFQEVEATVIYSEFGQCHNIVANPQTNFVYAVGSRFGNYPNICDGTLTSLLKWKASFFWNLLSHLDKMVLESMFLFHQISQFN